MAKDAPVTLAAIAGAHGVTGEVRLKLFTESLDGLKRHKSFNAGALTLKSIRPHKGGALARFNEITDRNGAEAARGTALTVPREALPAVAEDEYYYSDLIGLPCVSSAGDPIGICVAVENFGASDVIEIEKPDGKKFMVPMTKDAVPEWGEEIVVDAAYVN
ncbi:ribosome maturation factor RimM [Sphingorhabdus arenilitoris]|uniref:Ribosome maturation factor RimM n=1 Tax=Sphingorhabdus arenilitoris TaxID=1490041 RepID=A0ABV8RF05_9SPHN